MKSALMILVIALAPSLGSAEGPRADGPGPHHRRGGPPPELDEATRGKLEELKTKYEAASTQEEKDGIRAQIRELFHSSRSEGEKKGVRRFLKDHPPRVEDGSAKEGESSGGR